MGGLPNRDTAMESLAIQLPRAASAANTQPTEDLVELPCAAGAERPTSRERRLSRHSDHGSDSEVAH